MSEIQLLPSLDGVWADLYECIMLDRDPKYLFGEYWHNIKGIDINLKGRYYQISVIWSRIKWNFFDVIKIKGKAKVNQRHNSGLLLRLEDNVGKKIELRGVNFDEKLEIWYFDFDHDDYYKRCILCDYEPSEWIEFEMHKIPKINDILKFIKGEEIHDFTKAYEIIIKIIKNNGTKTFTFDVGFNDITSKFDISLYNVKYKHLSVIT